MGELNTMFTLYQIAGSCDGTENHTAEWGFCRFTPREKEIAHSLLLTRNNADFGAIYSVTDEAAPR